MVEEPTRRGAAPGGAPGAARGRRARQRSVYCTRAQWAAIGARAVAAGLSISRLVVGCALGESHAENGPRQESLFDHRLVLTHKEQRTLWERVAALERYAQALFVRAPGAGVSLLEALLVLRGKGSPGEAQATLRRNGTGERLGRAGAPILTTHSISCTDEEWAHIRERSARAGQSMSAYLVERARSARLPGADASSPTPRLVLDEAQQRALYEGVERIAKHMHGVGAGTKHSEWIAALEDAVEAVLDRAFDAPARGGEPLRPALARVLGARRAPRVAARLEARRGGDASPSCSASPRNHRR